MIGIVVVSHSRALAEAAAALAEEMVESDQRPTVRIAAGLDATTFGTDAAAVAEAIGEADSPDGVLVLLDLGSAVLSAEMALEFVDPEVAGRVRLSAAPLVEGLVAAVVTAGTGADLDTVLAEARQGLVAKQHHLGDDVPTPAAGAEETGDGAGTPKPDRSAEILVSNEHGLHARPAARLVSLVRGFDATVALTNLDTGKGPVNAASLSMVATLDARHGHRVQVDVTGPEAAAALEAIQGLAAQDFGDRVVEAPAPRPASAGSGLDLVIGPAIVVGAGVDTSAYQPGTPDEETARLHSAVDAAVTDLTGLRKHAAATVGEGEAEIFDAHLALLQDPEVTAGAVEPTRQGTPATEAWRRELDVIAAEFDRLPDPYQRARAQDVRSVRDRVLAHLVGSEVQEVEGTGVLVVPELDAATAAALDPEAVLGIVTITGGATGHGVIVAKSRGIPILTDVGEQARGVRSGTVVAFDASTGSFLVDPDEEERRQLEDELVRRRERRVRAVERAHEPATTTDGVTVAVAANIASVADATAAHDLGADGAGLVRTEVLFGHLDHAPSVAEQEEAFRALAAELPGKPLTIRTWDVGGDKPLPFLPLPAEANPFLGERGIRVFRSRPALLRDQLQAVCRVAHDVPLEVMFPMVSTADEVAWARQQLAQAAEEATGGMPQRLRVGIMVEVPAAALRIGRLAAGLDFVSIGTNDLTQYAFAAERGNRAVAGLVDQYDPAVLGLVDQVCRGVPDGVEVAVCGALASEPEAAVALVGLGVRVLSATAPAVPMVKAALRSVSREQARDRALAAVDCDSGAAVRALLRTET